MGRQKLGDFIRAIDYLGAKDGNDYEDSDDNPGNQLIEFEHQCTRDDDKLTFEELKDGYAAFQTKVCIAHFPSRHSPAYWVAYSTVCVLERLTRDFKDEEKHKKEIGYLMVYTWLALLTAGPSSGQLDLMKKFVNDSYNGYLQSCPKAELAKMVIAMKITLCYDPNEEEEESTYASFLQDGVKVFFKRLTEEQCMQTQAEFLDLYMHYFVQMPTLSPTMLTYVGYLVRDMVDQFPDRNPYLNLKDVMIMSSHLSQISDIMMWVEGDLKQYRIEDILKKIFAAALKDGQVPLLFPVFTDVIVQFAKLEKTQENRELIFDAYRLYFFRKFKEFSIVPDATMLENCVHIMHTIMTGAKTEPGMDKMVEEAHGKCFMKLTKPDPQQMEVILTAVVTMLQPGRKNFAQMAKETISDKVYKSCLDWKIMLSMAEVLMYTVGKLPCEKMQKIKESVRKLKDFMEELLEQLRKSKTLTQLQKVLVDFIFNCLVINSPQKAELANLASSDKYLILSVKTDEALINEVLRKVDELLKGSEVNWDNTSAETAVDLLQAVIKAYNGNGKAVTDEQNNRFMSIFKTCLAGETIEDHFFPPDIEEYHLTVHFRVFTVVLGYFSLHQQTSTLDCCAPIFPDILKWAMVSASQDHELLVSLSFGALCSMTSVTPNILCDDLPFIMELFVNTDHQTELFSLVNTLYPLNPTAVHERMKQLLDKFDDFATNVRSIVVVLFHTVASKHPEVFTQPQITVLMDACIKEEPAQKHMYLHILRCIAEKCPKNLADHFPKFVDDKAFAPDTLLYRTTIIACVGAVTEKWRHTSIDYLMKYITHSDPNIQRVVIGQLSSIVKTDTEYMQKYKSNFQAVENSTTVPNIKEYCHNVILVLEGKSLEGVYDEVQQTQEDLGDLDTKVGVTINTVITLGEHVVEQSKDITGMKKGIDVMGERVDVVEEDLGETKVKVEEIDNKTMTNAPKWSRDLTKLMNPKSENDWRLLASRLGYSYDDIRGWAQQNDPCMALLSEWYATHKTSEANFAVLTILQEMNRQDGVAIMENAMKAAEGVVEDEEFEYPSPPQIFLSYQWGVQEEVKLLKQHLNMAGYECWMDIGQMGGGDKLFAKIDNGIRAAKVVICCTTEKYAKSPNCNREVNLSVSLNKPIIPLLMEKMNWPPKGAMGPIFSEYLFIRFFQRGGEETQDQRYWPIPKFQELLMQLNFYVVPVEALIQKEYASWWTPIVEEIKIDKSKGNTTSTSPNNANTQVQASTNESPLVFLSYQWGKQPQVKVLYQRLVALGYTVWMDIYQMGGGDSLYDKIDKGMRGCQAVVSCITPKYSLSANCRREVSLADALKKPMIPLLLEQMKWPPDGPMSLVFTELLFINFYRTPEVQMVWKGEKFDELVGKLQHHIPEIQASGYQVNDQEAKEEENKMQQNGDMKQNVDKKQDADKKQDVQLKESSTSAAVDKASSKPPNNMEKPPNNTEKPPNKTETKSKSCVLL